MNKVLEDWLNRMHALRRAHEAAKTKLMAALHDAETNNTVPWAGAFASFDAMLRETGLASVQEYRSYVAALSIGVDEVTTHEIGFAATAVAGRIADDTVRKRVVAEFTAKAKEIGHPIAARTARETAAALGAAAPPLRGPAVERAERIAKLENELREMTAKRDALQEEVDTLRAENKRLRAQLRVRTSTRTTSP